MILLVQGYLCKIPGSENEAINKKINVIKYKSDIIIGIINDISFFI